MHHVIVLFFILSNSYVMSSFLFVLSAPSHINLFPCPTPSHTHTPPKLSRNSQKGLGPDGPSVMLKQISLRSTLVSVTALAEIWHPSGGSSDTQLIVWSLFDLVLLYPGAGTYKGVPVAVCCWRLNPS